MHKPIKKTRGLASHNMLSYYQNSLQSKKELSKDLDLVTPEINNKKKKRKTKSQM